MNTLQSSSIKLLPEFLIDQIKAGEVIERPANLVKEVIENAIDAQAKKIEIHLVNNGLKQIAIRDDGDGIAFEDLPYAFCRHATSKIEKFQDLYSLDSFGFRGEALASIASVAQVTCISRQRNQAQGGQFSIAGGQSAKQDHIPQAGIPPGTLLVIKELFFNTPVRLNFIKSQVSERNALLRILHSFFISHPQITFHLKWDREEKSIFPPTDRLQRFAQVISSKRWNKEDFCFFEKKYEDYRLTGLYGKLTKKSRQTKNQYLFVNKRLIQDKALHAIALSALEHCWPQGTSAPYLLEFDIPKDQVDVNVHPNKTMIKFSRPSVVHSLTHSTLRASISQNPQPMASLPPGAPNGDPEKPRSSPAPSCSPQALFFESPPLDSDSQTTQTNNNPSPLPPPRSSHYSPPRGHRRSAFPPPAVGPQSPQNSPVPPLLQPMAIGPRYTVLPRANSCPLIIDHWALIHFHLDFLAPQFATHPPSPLLVGTPFRQPATIAKIRNHPHWERDHFEFEQLNDNLIILRSVPESLAQFPHPLAIYHLSHNREQFSGEMAQEPLSPKALNQLTQQYSPQQLIAGKAALLLNPDYLGTLFQ